MPEEQFKRWWLWLGAIALPILHGAAPRESLGPSSRRTDLVISEIMYKPADRGDKREVEYLELYNSSPFPINLDGYQLDGILRHTFPRNTLLAGNGFLVLARAPEDVRAVYQIANVLAWTPTRSTTNVVGTTTNIVTQLQTLPSIGELKLLNPLGARLLTVNYSDQPPWPAPADGGGHSLVLARPSLGEKNPEAWDISRRKGGSPGGPEPVVASSPPAIVINEFLANPAPPGGQWIEVYNYSNTTADLSDLYLSDSLTKNKFRFPVGTRLTARSATVISAAALGFTLDRLGGTLVLNDAGDTRVLDSVRYDVQAEGFSTGRWPDGAAGFHPLAIPSPGSTNAPPQIGAVVISEIMPAPVRKPGLEALANADEFVELFNRTTAPINLGEWTLSGGLSYRFPAGTYIRPGQRLAVARDVTNLFVSLDKSVTCTNLMGNYVGKLDDSADEIILSRPGIIHIPKKNGQIETNRVLFPVDRFRYHTGAVSPWAHRGGASLELVDPRSPGASGISQWTESELNRSNRWISLNLPGSLEESWGGVDRLEFHLSGPGDCLLDEIRVRSQPNRGSAFQEHVLNGSFEASADGWFGEGNHGDSVWETTEGQSGSHSLHLVATGPGDSVEHRAFTRFDPAVPAGSRFVVTARVKWLRGASVLTARLANTRYATSKALAISHPGGTPGFARSAEASNAGPTITEIAHEPVLPAANQPIVIHAQIRDVDGVGVANLRYRVDPETSTSTITLRDDGAQGDQHAGDSVYSATLPAQPAGALIAYQIRAEDVNSVPAMSISPTGPQEFYVRFGDSQLKENRFGSVRLWAPTVDLASSGNPGSFPATVIYGDERIISRARAEWSPAPKTNGLIRIPGRLLITLPAESLLQGVRDWSLRIPSDDSTLLRSSTAQRLAADVGLPTSHIRPVQLLINGQRLGGLAESYQETDGDYLDEWFAGKDGGDLFELSGWLESTNSSNAVNFRRPFTLTNHLADNADLIRAYYRQTARLRQAASEDIAFDRLRTLAAAAHAPTNGLFKSPLLSIINEDQWRRSIAFRHALGDLASFGCRESRAGFAYKPDSGNWQLLADPNVAVMNAPGTAGPTADDLYELNSAEDGLLAFFGQPENRRAYNRALAEIAQRAMDIGPLRQWLAQRTAILREAGYVVDSTEGLETWLSLRRAYLLERAGASTDSFQVLTPSNQTLATNTVRLIGLGPPIMDTLRLNGREIRLTWGNESNWSATTFLAPGMNQIQLQAYDRLGAPIPEGAAVLELRFAAPAESPANSVVINEIHYHPVQNGSAFVELFNRSATTGFDLTGWQLKGVDYTFPLGAFIAPRGYIVIAANHGDLAATFGASIPVAGEFPGTLANEGEILRLIVPGESSSRDTIVDKIAYSAASPWPAMADGRGGSLQLLDPAQDRSSPYNWTDGFQGLPPGLKPGIYPPTPGRPNLSLWVPPDNGQPPVTNSTPVEIKLPLIPKLRINEVQSENLSSITNRFGEPAPWIELYNYGTNVINLAGMALSTNITNPGLWSFPADLTLGPRDFLLVWADGRPERTGAGEFHANFRLSPTNGQVLLSWTVNGALSVLDSVAYRGLAPGQSFGGATDGEAVDRVAIDTPRPGSQNRIFTLLYINEWMPGNTSFFRDEADGKYEDWIELYNATPLEVDLSGYYLSDTPTNRSKWQIPNGFSIGPNGHRVIWADDEPGQTKLGGELHAGFSLAQVGESLALYAPDETLVDSITYSELADNRSAGRYPDGSANIRAFELASPGSSNAVPPATSPPAKEPCFLGGEVIAGKVSLWGAPTSVLSFWLDPGGPPGVSVDRSTGDFRWATLPDQNPGTFNFTITVCDIRPGAVPLAARVSVVLQPHLRLLGGQATSPEGFQVFWQGPICYPARLQFRESLTEGNWESQPGTLQSQGSMNQLNVPVSQATGFFRLVYE